MIQYRLSFLYFQFIPKFIARRYLKSKIFDRILDIIVYSGNKGIYVMDRGFDDKTTIKTLIEYDASFIIRMKKNRNVFYKGDLMNICKAGDKIKKRYKYISKNKKEIIEAGISDIEIPVNGHPIKHPPLVKVKLISVKITTKHNNGKITKGKFLLITSLSDKEYPKAEFCKMLLDAYRLRWKIEEVHRHVKTEFHWEEIQLLKFNRLQAMNTLLWFIIGFIYQLDYMKYRFAEIFTSFMLD